MVRSFGVVAVLMAVLVGTARAPVDEAPPSWASAVRESRDLTTPVVAQGRVLDGRGVGRAARVTLLAWPRSGVIERLQVDDEVALLPVATTVATRRGDFHLRVDPAVLLADAMTDGLVNFDVVAEHEDRVAIAGFPRTFRDGTWSSPDGGRPDAAVTLRLEPATAPRAAPAPRAASLQIGVCPATLKQTYAPRMDIVGEVYTGPNAKAAFTYKTQSETTLGWATSVGGTGARFEQRGEATWTSTFEVGYPVYPPRTQRALQTEFVYGRWQVICPFSVFEEVRPKALAGGTYGYATAAVPPATFCTAYAKGSKPKKTTARAIKFTNGMDMSDHIGIDLSTTSGFSTEVSMAFEFLADGRLCGTDAFPPDASRVVAK